MLRVRPGVKLQKFRINNAHAVMGEEAHGDLLYGHRRRKLSADFQIPQGAPPPAVQIVQGTPDRLQKIRNAISPEHGTGIKTRFACKVNPRHRKTVFR